MTDQWSDEEVRLFVELARASYEMLAKGKAIESTGTAVASHTIVRLGEEVLALRAQLAAAREDEREACAAMERAAIVARLRELAHNAVCVAAATMAEGDFDRGETFELRGAALRQAADLIERGQSAAKDGAAAREDEREACAALAEKVFDEHPLTLDRRHEPGCICHAIARGSCSECDRGAAILAALRGQGGAR